MIIGIVPKIKKNRSSFDFSIDNDLISFFSSVFPKSQIKVLLEKRAYQIDLLILSGGNTPYHLSKTKENMIRKSLDLFHLKLSKKGGVPTVGICHGAQIIACKYKSKIIKQKGHVKKEGHTIFYKVKDKTRKLVVNSYHDFCIIKLGDKLEQFALSYDNTIEAFKHKDEKIFGIMWHPERYKKIKSLDQNFFRSII